MSGFGQSVLIAAFAASLNGCAWFTNYSKNIDLTSTSVSMDVKQRIVLSKKRGSTDDARVICAEPSPDALTVMGASGGLSVSNGSGGSLTNVSAAMAETGAFIGLRTQSIQLLRDAMYRLCEGYASGGITNHEFAAMQRRYQSTMMGLIAIEQLTRPVVASQVVLASSASAQAGATAGDAAVDKAQTRYESTVTARITAQTDVDTATAQSKKADADKTAAIEELNAENAKPNPDPAVTNALKDSLPGLEDNASKAHIALTEANRKLQAAQSAETIAKADLLAAKSAVAASASGSGQIHDVSQASAQMTDKLVTGVTSIVTEINLSYTRDSCFSLMADLVGNETLLTAYNAPSSGTAIPSPSDALKATLAVCTEILVADLKHQQALMGSRQQAQ